LKEARREVLTYVPEFRSNLEDLEIAAEIVAQDVKTLIRANPGWDRKTALARAIADRKKDGVLKVEQPSGLGRLNPFSSSKATVDLKGKAAASAIAVDKPINQIKAGELQLGNYYKFSDGSVGRVTSTGIELDEDDEDEED
jgi:hypothetical protein